jgi:hypothetical protein
MALRKLYSKKSAFVNVFSNARNFSASSRVNEKVAATKSVSVPKISDWDRAVEEAVKCVGYQTPYLTLRYLTNDDDVKWLENMKKLEGSQHPMSETAK